MKNITATITKTKDKNRLNSQKYKRYWKTRTDREMEGLKQGITNNHSYNIYNVNKQ